MNKFGTIKKNWFNIIMILLIIIGNGLSFLINGRLLFLTTNLILVGLVVFKFVKNK